MEKYWFAIYVRLFHELKVRQQLEAMGIRCFVPVRREMRIWHDRRVMKERVLTPQLIFVQATEQERRQVLSLSCVSHTLCTPGTHLPARIPNLQMEHFVFFIEQSLSPVNFVTTPLVKGDAVRIVSGPLAGLQGIVVDIKKKKYFAIRIDILGCAIMEITGEELIRM